MFFLVLSFINLTGQKTGWGIHESQLLHFFFDVNDTMPLRSSDFTVIYELSRITPHIDRNRYVKERMALQAGDKIGKFFSYDIHQIDRNSSGLTADIKNRERGFDYSDYEIFTNYPESMITVTHREPFSNRQENKAYYYEEPLPDIEWEITDERREILGYETILAKTRFGDREWLAWFTTEIPVNAGPWKLRGLPGLILAAQDSEEQYSFEAIEITNTPESINWHNWSYKKLSKKGWYDLERKFHASPLYYFSKGGEITFTNIHTMQELDDSWSIPYNPIELK